MHSGRAAGGPKAGSSHRTVGRAGAGERPSGEAGRQTEPTILTRTITKIVRVIPRLAFILIAGSALLAIAFLLQSRLAERRAKRLDRERGRLAADIGSLQAALLAEPEGSLSSAQATVAYRPAEGPGAGGDFYDVFKLGEGRLAMIVGDLSGHGRAALRHTALLRFTLRAHLQSGRGPRDAIAATGAALSGELDDCFATVAVAIYDEHDRTLIYSTAGHPPPLICGERALPTVSAGSSPPIGSGLHTGRRETVVDLRGAAAVCLYTDGLTDASAAGELFGTGRLEAELRSLRDGVSAQKLVEAVLAKTDHRRDDIAACVLIVDGGGEAPRIISEQILLDAADLERGRLSAFLCACGVEDRSSEAVSSAARQLIEAKGEALLDVLYIDGKQELRISSPVALSSKGTETSSHGTETRSEIQMTSRVQIGHEVELGAEEEPTLRRGSTRAEQLAAGGEARGMLR